MPRAPSHPRRSRHVYIREIEGSLTHASLAEVGRAFGKDHTTVLHAVDKIQTLLQHDPKFKKTIDTLTQGVTT